MIFASLFGIKPWEIDLLTHLQYEAFAKAAYQYVKEANSGR